MENTMKNKLIFFCIIFCAMMGGVALFQKYQNSQLSENEKDEQTIAEETYKEMEVITEHYCKTPKYIQMNGNPGYQCDENVSVEIRPKGIIQVNYPALGTITVENHRNIKTETHIQNYLRNKVLTSKVKDIFN